MSSPSHENSPAAQFSVRATLAHNMISLRHAREWSQERLALEAGLHRTFIAHVERQARNLSLDSLERIANALSVEPFELLIPVRRLEHR
jgi:transcriptional regulator with XRE-family HTH domain